MNAAQAAKLARDIRENKALARKLAEEKRSRNEAAAWRKERADYLIEFHNRVRRDIDDAVKDGKKKITIEYLAGCGGSRNLVVVAAKECYEQSKLHDLTEKVFKSFRAQGFSIKLSTFSSEHYVSYDTSDTSDEKYYSYHVGATISWEK